ncbi:glutamine synthetase, type I [Gleimia coleocanis DSM 15436]|uniref:Glutamine synthetase n=1 Tax=Gleimia coleocanis DSM 15436 TaxID=525245 RepID=C0W1G0_9ACTO|nr:type I glutamate--ammonia ligase [Gleimia coleocanis]EEH63326.1 glutamine synthetase, type I [Gleimia coleocanis DSM 15436]
MFTSREELLAFVAENNIEQIDVRFCDLPGVQQHITIPATQLEAALENGVMFDGSSIRGFTQIHESDMKLVADIASAYLDPFRTVPTLNMNFSIVDPFTDEPFGRDPRQVAQKAENYLRSTGIADTCYIGAEAEFFVFNGVRFQSQPHHTVFEIESDEGYWNSGRKSDETFSNMGHIVPQKGGYFPVAPMDAQADWRDYTSTVLSQCGLKVERHHHECGSGGQQEINYRFDSLTHAADDMLKFKYIVRNCALESGLTATFMPKPLSGDNGSGMHCHLSLWKNGEPLFYDATGYGALSDTARWFIGGLLRHAPALLAFTNPSVNSYRRLVPGFEAPINLVYSARNRSACIRIPVTGTSPKAKRVEYRVPDPTANPYLAFAACLMAGIDGIRNRIEPPAPVDKDLYELPPAEYQDIEKLPTSLEAALDALREDYEFLLEGNVFTEDLIETWINYKETKEIAPMRALVHPYEFHLYYNV